MKQIALDIGLPSEPMFSNYLAGPNQPVLSHLQLWAGGELRSPVPIYLWGATGSGKTHLMRAAAHALRDRGARIGWLDASCTEPPDFEEAWSAVFFDDCHLFTAVQQQAAFSWFVRALHAADGRPRGLLAAGLNPPADLRLREDLRTRLGWGHVFSLQPLDDEHRRAVLRQQADSRGLVLSDEVIAFILSRFSRDLTHLVQLIDQLDAYSLQTHRPITIALIKAMLESA